MTSTVDSRTADQTGVPHRRHRWVLPVVAVAQLMIVLDSSIVNIALPQAWRDLQIGTLAAARWGVTEYALAFGGLLLIGGRVADLFGRKRAFRIGLIGFAVASGVGGAATGGAMLIAARVVQGGFAALLAAAALSILATTYTAPKERSLAFAVYGGISGGGSAVGLLLGGLLTESVSRRWRLFVNIPVAILRRRDPRARRLDGLAGRPRLGPRADHCGPAADRGGLGRGLPVLCDRRRAAHGCLDRRPRPGPPPPTPPRTPRASEPHVRPHPSERIPT